MSGPIIALTDVSLQYNDFTALDSVSFAVGSGQIMTLLGHNGAGKSSLIKIILGLITPTSGSVTILGQSALDSQARNSVRLGYLPEDASFYDKLTGYEVLSYFAALKGVSRRRVESLIDEFGLEYAQHRQLKTYSKGMKQRLGVAQAILSEPKILLLDEPTVGLDPQASQFLYSKINQLKRAGCAVVISTHELSLVEAHLDCALIMSKGKRLALGSCCELSCASSLKTTIKFNELTESVKSNAYLQQFYRDGLLHIRGDQKSALVQHLVSQCQIFDFEIKEPRLEDIYHDLMEQDLHS
ncbi:ABC transporter ATP-binding protein [Shewanella sp. D64]|uniref:ABC transporter ATP-binding protein n=1 Tax=unclassified Shewanella TaxID=196818 RepID=UPI0022BA1C5C|nr:MULTISPECIES: ABC transporter ATP-binding protein [unclassified Shewanella]MEC4728015.1 ABC transporter ATP-binding protein [Shewanella sp. D64]MEC4740140.1 ABC transporter ATP-binding protein [Shewanella sp. E94]WBJ95200.1 ABC transporter ATP-binding protein [Shewanella sp. MTB7]